MIDDLQITGSSFYVEDDDRRLTRWGLQKIDHQRNQLSQFNDQLQSPSKQSQDVNFILNPRDEQNRKRANKYSEFIICQNKNQTLYQDYFNIEPKGKYILKDRLTLPKLEKIQKTKIKIPMGIQYEMISQTSCKDQTQLSKIFREHIDTDKSEYQTAAFNSRPIKTLQSNSQNQRDAFRWENIEQKVKSKRNRVISNYAINMLNKLQTSNVLMSPRANRPINQNGSIQYQKSISKKKKTFQLNDIFNYYQREVLSSVDNFSKHQQNETDLSGRKLQQLLAHSVPRNDIVKKKDQKNVSVKIKQLNYMHRGNYRNCTFDTKYNDQVLFLQLTSKVSKNIATNLQMI